MPELTPEIFAGCMFQSVRDEAGAVHGVVVQFKKPVSAEIWDTSSSGGEAIAELRDVAEKMIDRNS